MSAYLLGLGRAVPAQELDRAAALALMTRLSPLPPEQERGVRALYRRTGIETRRTAVFDPGSASPWPSGADPTAEHGPGTAARMALYAEVAGPLAVAAASEALERADVAVSRMTHLVTVSCTGFGAPGIDQLLIRDLDLSPSVQRTHIGFMGCHGALNGLRVARAFVEAEPDARVLLVAAEICSVHVQHGWEDEEQVVANALFGDGAAAAVIGTAPEPAAMPRPWRIARSGSHLFRDSAELMTWTVGDHGFRMGLSARVPALLAEHLGPWLSRWLAEAGLGVDDVGCWAVHPGGTRILGAVECALGLGPDALATSREVLRRHGNMSSPTVLFVLDALWRAAARGPCVALAFGPGLVAEVTLFTGPEAVAGDDALRAASRLVRGRGTAAQEPNSAAMRAARAGPAPASSCLKNTKAWLHACASMTDLQAARRASS